MNCFSSNIHHIRLTMAKSVASSLVCSGISYSVSQTHLSESLLVMLSHKTHTHLLFLKMIGKGFVLFKINSSPSAFYIIKPTCISWLVFKVSNYFKKLSKSTNSNVCLCWLVMTSSPSESKRPACLYSRTALNLIFGTLSAQFKFNNNVERWNWQSWFIYTAGLQLLQASLAWTQPVRPVSHTFSYYRQWIWDATLSLPIAH